MTGFWREKSFPIYTNILTNKLKEMKETTQMVLWLAAIASQTVEAASDGDGLNFKDYHKYIDEMMDAPEALMGAGKIPNEIRNADVNQRNELIETVSKEIQDITPQRIDILIGAAERVGIALSIAIAECQNNRIAEDKAPVNTGDDSPKGDDA